MVQNSAANPQGEVGSDRASSRAVSEGVNSKNNKIGGGTGGVLSRQPLHQKEAAQRLSRWSRPGARGSSNNVPRVFARPLAKKTTVAQQRAADLRRSQGISVAPRAASMRPRSAYIAARPCAPQRNTQRVRPQSGRRLRNARMQSNTIAGRGGPNSTRMKRSNYFRSAPVAQRRFGANVARTRLANQLQERIQYSGNRGLVGAGKQKLDLRTLLGMQN